MKTMTLAFILAAGLAGVCLAQATTDSNTYGNDRNTSNASVASSANGTNASTNAAY